MYTCTSQTNILVRKSTHVGQIGENPRACLTRDKLNGEVAGHANILAVILARKSVRMSASVTVLLPWNSNYYTLTTRTPSLGMRLSCSFVHYSLSCTLACIPNGHPYQEKVARVRQMSEDPCTCLTRGE